MAVRAFSCAIWLLALVILGEEARLAASHAESPWVKFDMSSDATTCGPEFEIKSKLECTSAILKENTRMGNSATVIVTTENDADRPRGCYSEGLDTRHFMSRYNSHESGDPTYTASELFLWCRKALDPVPLYQFYNDGTEHHSYSLSSAAPSNYESNGIGFYVFTEAVYDSVPIYNFYSAVHQDHKYDRSDASITDYVFYAYSSHKSGRIPIYEYRSSVASTSQKHRLSTGDGTPSGYTSEGIAFYVPKAPHPCITGSTGTSCETCVTQWERKNDAHCASCNPGYYLFGDPPTCKAATLSWEMVHSTSQGNLECPHVSGTDYGWANCPVYADAQTCQNTCLSAVVGCNGINFKPTTGTCCFKSCVDPHNPVFSDETGYEVYIHREAQAAPSPPSTNIGVEETSPNFGGTEDPTTPPTEEKEKEEEQEEEEQEEEEEVVECSMSLEVTNARQFVAEPDVVQVITDFLAELLKIAKGWLRNIIVKLLDGRRLEFLGAATGHGSGRILEDISVTTKLGVRIDFDVVIPPDGGEEEVTATLVMDRFESKSMQEATDTINKVLKSGVLGSKDYDVQVIVKKSSVKTGTPETATAASKDDMVVVMAIVLAVSGCLVSGLAVFVTWYCRKKCPRVGKEDDTSLMALVDAMIRPDASAFSEKYLLNPPGDVSADCQSSVVSYVSGMLDVSKPAIFVCFAAGSQEDGPGLFFAAAVIRALHNHDVPCYCLLPGSKEIELCLGLLSGEDTSCKAFVIVDTGDIYRSRRCLEQIRTASANRIETTRLQFETDLPTEDERWYDICLDDIDCEKMRAEVATATTFLSSAISPEPPNTVQTVPSFLDTFALDMQHKLKSLNSYAAMGKMKDAAVAINRMQKLARATQAAKMEENNEAKIASLAELGSSPNLKASGASQESGNDVSKTALKLKNVQKFAEAGKNVIKEGRTKTKKRSIFSMGGTTSSKSALSMHSSADGELSMSATVSTRTGSAKDGSQTPKEKRVGSPAKGPMPFGRSKTEGDMSKTVGKAKQTGLTAQARAKPGSDTSVLGKTLSTKKKDKKPSLDSEASTMASATSVRSNSTGSPPRRKLQHASSTPSTEVSFEASKTLEDQSRRPSEL